MSCRICWLTLGLVAGPTITLLYAGGDEEEHNSVPHAKIVDCITSCISVGNIRDILEHKKDLVNVILVFLSLGIPWTGTFCIIFFHFLPCESIEDLFFY